MSILGFLSDQYKSNYGACFIMHYAVVAQSFPIQNISITFRLQQQILHKDLEQHQLLRPRDQAHAMVSHSPTGVVVLIRINAQMGKGIVTGTPTVKVVLFVEEITAETTLAHQEATGLEVQTAVWVSTSMFQYHVPILFIMIFNGLCILKLDFFIVIPSSNF